MNISKYIPMSPEWCSFNLQGLSKFVSPEATTNLQHPDIDRNAFLKDGEKLLLLDLKPLVDSSAINVMFHEDTNEEVKRPNKEYLEKNVCKDIPEETDEIDSVESSNADVKSKKNIKNITANSDVDTQHDHGRFDDAEEQHGQPENALNNSHSAESFKIQSEHDLCSVSRINREWRRFNLDLAPKLLYSGGSMVELLITSDVAKYCEFKTFTRVLTRINNQLKPVPCSRSDIFNSKDITMAEKRILMKFLKTCMTMQQEDALKDEDMDKPFIDFLKSQKLTDEIQHYILYSIAMVEPEDSTKTGLMQIQKFLQSLGRYGNTAFLWPLYGSGELPQCFCRLCAVFGGTYCLRMSASALIIDSTNKCTGIITTNGERINTKWLIMGSSFAPGDYFVPKTESEISRAIFITNGSILDSESEELSLLHLPCSEDGKNPVTVLELPPSSMACPPGFHLVHLTKSTGKIETPEKSLSDAVETLFAVSDKDKPKILWSAYFKQKDLSGVKKSEDVPGNVFIVSGPGIEIDLDCIVSEVKGIFKQILPDEEFLPRPPNPEDIIYVDKEEAAVGDAVTENDNTASEISDTAKDEGSHDVITSTFEGSSCATESGGMSADNEKFELQLNTSEVLPEDS